MNNIFQKIKSISYKIWAWIKSVANVATQQSSGKPNNQQIVDRLETHKTKIKLRKPRVKKVKKQKK